MVGKTTAVKGLISFCFFEYVLYFPTHSAIYKNVYLNDSFVFVIQKPTVRRMRTDQTLIHKFKCFSVTILMSLVSGKTHIQEHFGEQKLKTTNTSCTCFIK